MVVDQVDPGGARVGVHGVDEVHYAVVAAPRLHHVAPSLARAPARCVTVRLAAGVPRPGSRSQVCRVRVAGSRKGYPVVELTQVMGEPVSAAAAEKNVSLQHSNITKTEEVLGGQIGTVTAANTSSLRPEEIPPQQSSEKTEPRLISGFDVQVPNYEKSLTENTLNNHMKDKDHIKREKQRRLRGGGVDEAMEMAKLANNELEELKQLHLENSVLKKKVPEDSVGECGPHTSACPSPASTGCRPKTSASSVSSPSSEAAARTALLPSRDSSSEVVSEVGRVALPLHRKMKVFVVHYEAPDSFYVTPDLDKLKQFQRYRRMFSSM